MLGAYHRGISDYRPEGLAPKPDFHRLAKEARDRQAWRLRRLRNDPIALLAFICQYRAALTRRGEAGRRVGWEKVHVARHGGTTSRVELEIRKLQRNADQVEIEWFEATLRVMGINPATAQTAGFLRRLQCDATDSQLTFPLLT